MARYRRDSASPPEPEVPVEDHGDRGPPRRKDSSEETEIRTSSRDELIQCIKRGQRPTWVPKPNLEALCAEAEVEAEARMTKETPTAQFGTEVADIDPRHEGTLLPSPEAARRQSSAFHKGDFGTSTSTNGREIPQRPRRFISPAQTPYADSPPPWAAASPFNRFHRTISDPAGLDSFPTDLRNRSRAPSIGSSLSSSFVMRPPTSPLVHATSNLNIDVPDVDVPDSPAPPSKRRSTLDSGQAFDPPSLRKESTVPTRSHQSRRSLTSFTYQPALSASTIYPSRQRRLSHAAETASLQRNSMVGSFEESILRGRMSTAPSHPLEFVAKIGVSGKGACPSKLKCPAHVTVPFPAVFYNYPSSTGSRSISDDSPSPYVGTINLREHLEAPEERRPRNRRSLANDMDTSMSTDSGLTGSPSNGTTTSPGARSAIGGAYRVPQQGQLQIILKNPENTAVKLFLIPYDLEGMLPDTKTFVRQKSLSTGPVAENVLSDKPILDPLSTKHVLRYMIHLKFCCLSKGRFYLYDNIRVVFANRVPDGKEQLKNEIQVPEPRYSALSLPKSQPGSRRQSGIESFLSSPGVAFGSPRLDLADGLVASSPSPMAADLVPFRLAQNRSPTMSRKENLKFSDMKQPLSPTSNNSRPTSPEYGFERASISQRSSPVPWGAPIDLQPRSPSPAFNGDGLLSKKLRELGRQAPKTSFTESEDSMR